MKTQYALGTLVKTLNDGYGEITGVVQRATGTAYEMTTTTGTHLVVADDQILASYEKLMPRKTKKKKTPKQTDLSEAGTSAQPN